MSPTFYVFFCYAFPLQVFCLCCTVRITICTDIACLSHYHMHGYCLSVAGSFILYAYTEAGSIICILTCTHLTIGLCTCYAYSKGLMMRCTPLFSLQKNKLKLILMFYILMLAHTCKGEDNTWIVRQSSAAGASPQHCTIRMLVYVCVHLENC
jgi:hypothetical protein